VKKQQRLNYSLAAEMTTMIRDLEPAGVAIFVGGEIARLAGKIARSRSSTPAAGSIMLIAPKYRLFCRRKTIFGIRVP